MNGARVASDAADCAAERVIGRIVEEYRAWGQGSPDRAAPRGAGEWADFMEHLGVAVVGVPLPSLPGVAALHRHDRRGWVCFAHCRAAGAEIAPALCRCLALVLLDACPRLGADAPPFYGQSNARLRGMAAARVAAELC